MEEEDNTPSQSQNIVSKWRQKERLKTTAVALVMCINIGVDPPDVIKISPCARQLCWVDPVSLQANKALETIGDSPTHTHPTVHPQNISLCWFNHVLRYGTFVLYGSNFNWIKGTVNACDGAALCPHCSYLPHLKTVSSTAFYSWVPTVVWVFMDCAVSFRISV